MAAAVRIAQSVIHEMLAHARAAAPNECCGLLIGDRRRVERSARATNLQASPTRYLIDPADHFAAIREARSAGRRVVGAYHSHPAGMPVPSQADVAEASGGPDFLYVIVSLAGRPDGEVRGYRVNNGVVAAVELVCVSE